ncbi:ABC transporter permease [Paenibacillus caui]|uniref:ABC transporter permease n=1 Tax=Paenibacillus caui TaxID=2873927 RepID=UPI001CA9F807|nr:ABC transporter permease [Paenibacillus caui]
MNSFGTLFVKELVEAWRDKKLVWLPVVMCILAILQPISLYYMPQIMNKAGNLPPGTEIKIPVPTGEEVLAGTLSQFGVLGIAIVVLSVMGSIAAERNSGVLSLIMVRRVSPLQYIGSKWAAQAVMLLASFAASYLLACYYTALLFNQVAWTRILASLGIYSLWILFAMTITLGAGTLLRKSGGIAGISLAFIAALSLCSSLFPRFMKWSPSNAQSQAAKLLTEGAGSASLPVMLVSAAVLIAVIFFAAVACFKRYETYS